MNPKQFLQIVGVLLILLAVLGFLKPDLAGDFLSFSMVENLSHLSLGILAILLSPLPNKHLQKWCVVALGIGAIAIAALGFMVSGHPAPNVYGTVNLDHPVDNVLHAVLGLWALYAAFNKKQTSL